MERRQQISDLYNRALEHSPGERSAFLKAACNGDEALRQEVESLLQYDSDSARFLERPAAAIAADAAAVAATQRSMVNRQLGSYTIVAPLGAGGMGEVYRARDTKLGRDVAIKILPTHFTSDPERRARFAREARLLATLNHPHIGAIYGLEESDGLTALVLELVDGPTLADRLERGPLKIPETLAIARQIAEALEAAHEKGIVHRDLKPANIVLQGASGSAGEMRAKVLDFGLAKPMAMDLGGDPTQAPSVSLDGTAEGRILGTPAYMSPEQARGQTVDKRTDIWAFGCVLFEMMSGKRPFEGQTLTDTVARILEREPDWAALPAETPTSIRRLLERCLRKDPRKRLHDIADALIEIDDTASSAAFGSTSTAKPYRMTWERVRWITAAFLAGGLISAGFLTLIGRSAPEAPDPIELAMIAPAGTSFPAPAYDVAPFALSPDGSSMALLATTGNSRPSLWVRALGGEARPFRGTEGAFSPFWSSDSRQIGFFADGKLKRVSVTGGPAIDICDAPGGPVTGGATWSRDDVILFSSRDGSIHKVSSSGGPSTSVTTLQDGDSRHVFPWFLPDGQSFLFVSARGGRPQLRIGSLMSTESQPVGSIRSRTIYAAGSLLFFSDGGLMAQRFDTRSRQLIGDPTPVFEVAGLVSPLFPGLVFASERSVLAYRVRPVWTSQLTWFDRRGTRLATVGEPGGYLNLSLSPDDRHVAVSRGLKDNVDIWVIDLERGGDMRKVTSASSGEFDPTWSRPRGSDLIFPSNRTRGLFSLFRRPANGSGSDQLVSEAAPGRTYTAPDWSPDGRFVISAGSGNLWLHSLDAGSAAVPFLATPHIGLSPVFSPDGRFVAYSSDHTGRREVYVRPFAAKEPEYKVSRDGGSHPRWRSNGEIFFLSLDGTMMSARVPDGRDFHALDPKPLFSTGLPPDFLRQNQKAYDVTKDGQRFLIPVARETPAEPITVVTNWTARLRQ